MTKPSTLPRPSGPSSGSATTSTTVTASEAKNNLGALLAKIRRDHDAVVIENRGTPTAAIIPFGLYEDVRRWQTKLQRDQARATLERLRQELADQNRDLTAPAAQDLARQAVGDTVESLTKRGTIRFEE